MGESKILVVQYQCERCGHKWIPRKDGEPVICPKCKSAYWNKKKKWFTE